MKWGVVLKNHWQNEAIAVDVGDAATNDKFKPEELILLLVIVERLVANELEVLNLKSFRLSDDCDCKIYELKSRKNY